MTTQFKRIVLYARWHRANREVSETLQLLRDFLVSQKLGTQPLEIYLEAEAASHFTHLNLPILELAQLKANQDLIIVVGGDGSLLSAARFAVAANIHVLGINRGRLGFLTDILPEEIETKIAEILAGQFFEEKRFLLQASIYHHDQITYHGDALNDVVLLPGDAPHMIEFELIINKKPVCNQRADGLIIATPTGSTAYALSGGGPILHPQLNAISLVPMFPHTLSSRPIVIDGECEIQLHINEANEISPRLSCDGHERISVAPGDKIVITKKKQLLRLIHPLDYDYYQTLRAKLGWQSRQ